MADHDHSYKLLFSHPLMVRDLLEGFVREDWLEQLDYASLERVGGSYVTDDLRDRADDIVWRARWGEEWVYVYLLIEFQASVDRYMAVRVLTYVGLLYQDLIKSKQLPADGRLPPVLPIVLYNGSRRWWAAEELSALVQTGPRAIERYCAQMRYLLIDESRYRDAELASLRNLVAALFRLERSRTAAEIDDVLGRLVDWLKSAEQTSLRRAFAVWLGRVILARLPGERVKAVDDLQEMRAMLADRIQEWGEEFKRKGLEEGRKEGLQQGIQQGLQQGREEGLSEGEKRLLVRQLRKRFGELPSWVTPLVQGAALDQVERWSERLLDVDSLDAVFGGEQK